MVRYHVDGRRMRRQTDEWEGGTWVGKGMRRWVLPQSKYGGALHLPIPRLEGKRRGLVTCLCLKAWSRRPLGQLTKGRYCNRRQMKNTCL